MNQKPLFIVVVFLLGLLIGVLGYKAVSDYMDVISGSVPSSPVTAPTPTGSVATSSSSVCAPDPVQVLEPMAGSEVSFPLTVRFKVENRLNRGCSWTMFEAQAGVVSLQDEQGKEYAFQPLTASGDWMTDGPVEFSAVLAPTSSVPTRLRLVIDEEDPSGLGEVRTVTVPVIKASACTMKPETGPCKAAFKKYYFNKLTGTCESFTWGGCQGSVPFQTLEACKQSCQ